jgi:hypothetical protein
MSSTVLGWVFASKKAKGPDRMLLVAMADSANDDGYLSGEDFGSSSHMQRKCNFPSRQTLVEARNWLEQHHELLVLRPADRGGGRGGGRHNEYIVLMGRDPHVVAAQFGWPVAPGQDEGSATQTDRGSEAAGQPPAASAESSAIDPATVQDDAHRGVQAAPPAARAQQVTAPVDTASAPSETGSARKTDIPWTGPGPVQDRSTSLDASYTSPTSKQPSQLTAAPRPERGHARGAVRPVDSRLEWIHDQLAGLAPDVVWDLTDHKERQLLEHLAAWPDVDSGCTAFVAAAVESIDRFGLPRSVRAWSTVWLELAPPPPQPGEALCTEHPIDGIDVPLRACAVCRGRDVTPAQRSAP